MSTILNFKSEQYQLRRNRLNRKTTTQDKLKAAGGALIGTAIPLALMMKKQGVRNPFCLKYGLSDIITLSGCSILGGVAAGMAGNDSETNSAKAREGFFQFSNAAIPTWLSAASLKLCESSPKYNNAPAKILSVIGSVLIGMHGAASLSNIVCDPKDKYPDRKLTLKDSIANIDDVIGVFVLANFPFANKLHLDKLLPIIYAYCGYRAGKSN